MSKLNDFKALRSKAVPKTKLNDVSSNDLKSAVIISAAYNAPWIVTTVSCAAVILIILASSYLGIYLVATMFADQIEVIKKINLVKMSETIKVVVNNAVLLAGWVLYLKDKYHGKT